jgi:hypothetical protein
MALDTITSMWMHAPVAVCSYYKLAYRCIGKMLIRTHPHTDISVSHTPKVVDNATADIAAFLMLGALRRIAVPFIACREGQWRGKTELAHDPQNKTLGILGMGGIGKVSPLFYNISLYVMLIYVI